MIKITIKNSTALPSRRTLCFDLHEDFGLTYILEDGAEARLFLAHQECRTWKSADHPYLREVRWLDKDHVIAWDEDRGAVIISSADWRKLATGYPDQVLLSPAHIFVSHGEEAVNRPSENAWECEVFAVFSREGQLVFGLDEFLVASKFNDALTGFNGGYIYGETIIFNVYHSDFIYKLDVPNKILSRFPVAFSTTLISLLSGDERRAYAIYDNRGLLQHHPDRVLFEFAVFDLQSETAAREDFASIEHELIASGFKMETLKFQPSSTGKIIVSDSEKAAFLEFSDGM